MEKDPFLLDILFSGLRIPYPISPVCIPSPSPLWPRPAPGGASSASTASSSSSPDPHRDVHARRRGGDGGGGGGAGRRRGAEGGSDGGEGPRGRGRGSGCSSCCWLLRVDNAVDGGGGGGETAAAAGPTWEEEFAMMRLAAKGGEKSSISPPIFPCSCRLDRWGLIIIQQHSRYPSSSPSRSTGSNATPPSPSATSLHYCTIVGPWKSGPPGGLSVGSSLSFSHERCCDHLQSDTKRGNPPPPSSLPPPSLPPRPPEEENRLL